MILPQLRNGQPASSCGFPDQAGRRCLQEIAGGEPRPACTFARLLVWGPARPRSLRREPGCLRFEVGRVTEDPGSPLGGLPSAAALCLLLTWPQRTSPSRGPEAEQVGFSPAVSKQDHDPLEGREISSVAHELYL